MVTRHPVPQKVWGKPTSTHNDRALAADDRHAHFGQPIGWEPNVVVCEDQYVPFHMLDCEI
jgi:hypothetical protein